MPRQKAIDLSRTMLADDMSDPSLSPAHHSVRLGARRSPRCKPFVNVLLAGKVLTLLIQGIMAVGAAVVTLTTLAVVAAQDTINTELRAEFGPDVTAMPTLSIVSLLAVALVLCVLVFLFFGKLRGIIDTVADGDPFVPANADRLNAMGFLQIAIYAVSLIASGTAMLVADWARQFTDAEISASVDVDVPAILLIIVLFILARVFRHGAAMREDLEGTV